MKYRLIAIDLDGTLLNDKKQISDTNEKAIEDALNAGYKVTICTGRAFQSAKDYLSKIPEDIPVILQNGALIVKNHGKDVLIQKVLPKELALEILNELTDKFDLLLFKSFSKVPDIFFEDLSLKNPFSPYFQNNLWRMKKVESLKDIVDDEVVEITVMGEKSEVEKVLNSKEVFKKTSKIISGVLDNWVFCELFNVEVAKEKAIEFLANYYDLELSDIVFIGDNYNDLEVMKKVGLSIAMANAPDDVKKHAKLVVPSNEENGVAVALRKIMNGEV
ncbi:MAG: hypothetical protein PWQ20_1304 [Thermotogaceae bacterium]|nr:hypothetical protein [Thermotogaceae bacterium]MDN5338234.1 hypothetical protein [Thermotogaceae bacterium]